MTKGVELSKGYKPEIHEPDPSWIALITRIDKKYAMKTDYTKSVLFATIILENSEGKPQLYRILIDGNHRIYRALQEKIVAVPTITLSFVDTLEILTSLPKVLRTMRQQGKVLGLL